MRRQDRADISVPVEVMWTDRFGHERYTTAQSIDISSSGMRIQVPEPLPERSYVRLRADRLALAGSASVRTCSKKGTKFLLGLEFAGGLSWKAPRVSKSPDSQPVS